MKICSGLRASDMRLSGVDMTGSVELVDSIWKHHRASTRLSSALLRFKGQLQYEYTPYGETLLRCRR